MDISVRTLQEAISIRRQIDNLEKRLSSLLAGAPPKPTAPAGGRYFSPATRAKLAAAARARWARKRGATTAAPTRKKGQLTPAGRRKLSQLMKARWAARRKAAGTKKALRANESAVGSQKESRSEEVTSPIQTGIVAFVLAPLQVRRGLVLARGLEPPRVSPYGPEPYASANSATRA